jgi:hypothetical protein
MMSKAWRWMKGDQSNWNKLTHGKEEREKQNPMLKAKV